MINNKIYIGKYCGRSVSYLGSGRWIRAAISKHGRENFKRITIDTAENHDDLCRKEIFWIRFYNELGLRMYNVSEGGDGRTGPHSNETKIKMSLAKSGRELSAEHKHSLSLVQKGNKNASGNKGKKHSEETRNKLSLIRKGKKNPKVSIALKGRPKSDETKRRMRESQKLRWLRERVSHAEISL